MQTISIYGTVDAQKNATFVSQRITQRFKTNNIRASFAPGVNRLMKLSYFISKDQSAPTTEEPTGDNILKAIGQVGYITGDDEIKTFRHEVISSERGAYIKVYAENSDVFSHTIDTQVTIEFINENDNTTA